MDRNRIVQRFVQRGISRWQTRYNQLRKERRFKRVAKTMPQAATSLVDPFTRGKPQFRRRRDKIDWDYENPHPDIRAFIDAFLDEMDARFIPFVISEIKRTGERQDQLYALGRSKAKSGQSPHQYSLAVDLISFTKGWDLTPAQWAVVGTIGKEAARRANVSVEWGGDWSFYDPAHWQIKDWKSWKDFFLGEWPRLRNQSERANYRRVFKSWLETRQSEGGA